MENLNCVFFLMVISIMVFYFFVWNIKFMECVSVFFFTEPLTRLLKVNSDFKGLVQAVDKRTLLMLLHTGRQIKGHCFSFSWLLLMSFILPFTSVRLHSSITATNIHYKHITSSFIHYKKNNNVGFSALLCDSFLNVMCDSYIIYFIN